MQLSCKEITQFSKEFLGMLVVVQLVYEIVRNGLGRS